MAGARTWGGGDTSATSYTILKLYAVWKQSSEKKKTASVNVKEQHGCRAKISLYSSKTVDKKEILRAVSNTGIYCSSDKVVTVYLV
jgi:predicted transport protein